MKIRYDPEADALYMQVQDGEFDRNNVLDDYTIVDFDKQGKVLGVEILFVKKRNPELAKELLRLRELVSA